jgi:S-adenosylmethionine decarboxylase
MNTSDRYFPHKDNMTTFGLHLMLDAYGVEKEQLDDMKRIFKYLNELPEVIEMKKLSTPFVVDAEATKSGHDPGGISGFVMIAESHISIHTFARKGFFTMDCYSCTNFESKIEKLLEFTKQMFPYTEHELNVIKRGLKYPVEVTPE